MKHDPDQKPTDDPRRVPVTLHLLPEHLDQLLRRAEAEKRTISEVVEDALSDANVIDY